MYRPLDRLKLPRRGRELCSVYQRYLCPLWARPGHSSENGVGRKSWRFPDGSIWQEAIRRRRALQRFLQKVGSKCLDIERKHIPLSVTLFGKPFKDCRRLLPVSSEVCRLQKSLHIRRVWPGAGCLCLSDTKHEFWVAGRIKKKKFRSYEFEKDNCLVLRLLLNFLSFPFI